MKELEEKKDPEEIIEFNYFNRINNEMITIKDKRKIKDALDEMDKQERKQYQLISEHECAYHQNTDDILIEETTQFEQDLESAFQEVIDKMDKTKRNSEKVKSFLKEHIASLSEKQLNVIFLYYYLDFTVSEISKIMCVSKQRISQLIKKINIKLRKKSGKTYLQKPLL